MQSNNNDVYRIAAEKKGKSEQQYKDIGNFVFAELYSMLRKPKSLITKLKGVGFWYLRKKRIEHVVNSYPPDWEKTEEEFETKYGFLRNENKKEIHTLFKERLKEYQEYINDRQDIRKQRYGNQSLLEPPNEEESKE